MISVLAAVIVAIAGMSAGITFANASLSNTYSPQRAVFDYFAAQKGGDTNAMLANATLLRGDGSSPDLFGKFALDMMMKLPANSDLGDVRVVSTRVVDTATASVTVSMRWNGKQRSQTYTVRKDMARVHWYLYYSWRVDIPFVTLQVKVPNQAGPIRLDGIGVSASTGTIQLGLPQRTAPIQLDRVALPAAAGPSANLTFQAIQGFHTVSMDATDVLDSASQDVNGVDGSPTASFSAIVRPAAVTAAAAAVKDAFRHCDPVKFSDCFDHTYYGSDPNYVYFFTDLPGYGKVYYTKYLFTLAGDPTVNMKLVVDSTPGEVSASGVCAATLTVNGSQAYHLKGDFTATLTWSNGGFGADVTSDCGKQRA